MAEAKQIDWSKVGPELAGALKSAVGYLLNAKIDLETGASKRTAIATIDGGLKLARAALSKAGVE